MKRVYGLYLSVLVVFIILFSGCSTSKPYTITADIVGAVEGEVTPDKISHTIDMLKSRGKELGVSIEGQQKDSKRLEFKLAYKEDPELFKILFATAQLEIKTQDGKTFLTNQDLEDTKAETNPSTKQPQLHFQFNSRGKEVLADVTNRNVGKPIFICLDGQVVAAPIIGEPITTGEAVTSGMFNNIQEAEDYALLLRSGALPLKLKISNMTEGK